MQDRPLNTFRPKRQTSRRSLTLFGFVLSLCLLFTLPASYASLDTALGDVIAEQRARIEQDPSAGAYSDLGNLLLLDEKPREAEHAYRQALGLDSSHVAANYNLALLLQTESDQPASDASVHEKRGERPRDLREEARSLFERVVALDPDNGWSHYQLGRLHAEAGRRAEALKSYIQAFVVNPELASSDINPHIIGNRLAQEALLRAPNDEAPSAEGPPRAYVEPARIVNALVAPLQSSGTIPAVAATPEPEGTEPAAQGQPHANNAVSLASLRA